MNDVEHDLRELFDRKASSVGGVAPRLPEQVRKRSRRREVGTVLLSGLTALALVVSSVAVLRAVDAGRGSDRIATDDPWEGYEVFERTATIETLTITSPSNWYLVNQWPMGARAARGRNSGNCSVAVPPDGDEQSEVCSEGTDGQGQDSSFPMVPMLMLSNTDLGLGPSACLDGDLALQGDDAVLEVAIDTRAVDLIESGDDPGLPGWPVAFDPNGATGGPCGEGHYVRFQVGRYPYIAWAGFGPDASQEVRETLFEIASAMQIDQQAFVRGTRERTPAYVIAGGENAAGPWRLELRPSTSADPTANVELAVISPEGGGAGTGDFSVPGDTPIEQAGGDPTFGAVAKEASGVELRLEEGTPSIPATIVPLPPSMPFDFDLFFASNDADVQATAVALDDDGVPIAPSAPVMDEPSLATFLDDVDHLKPNDFWAPAVKREGEQVVMPVTFPDGATAELVYPATLALERLSVYPDAYATLEGRSSSCDWPVHASRYDPRDGWLNGEEPLDGYLNEEGRAFELWKGPGTHTYLITRAGPWNVIILCGAAKEVVGSVALTADLFSPRVSDDGLLVLETTPPLALQLADEGAAIRLSNRDVVVDLSSGRIGCQARSPDMGVGDDVIQWCIDSAGGVYLYATAFRPAGDSILEGLVAGLEVRNYRAAGR